MFRNKLLHFPLTTTITNNSTTNLIVSPRVPNRVKKILLQQSEINPATSRGSKRHGRPGLMKNGFNDAHSIRMSMDLIDAENARSLIPQILHKFKKFIRKHQYKLLVNSSKNQRKSKYARIDEQTDLRNFADQFVVKFNLFRFTHLAMICELFGEIHFIHEPFLKLVIHRILSTDQSFIRSNFEYENMLTDYENREKQRKTELIQNGYSRDEIAETLHKESLSDSNNLVNILDVVSFLKITNSFVILSSQFNRFRAANYALSQWRDELLERLLDHFSTMGNMDVAKLLVNSNVPINKHGVINPFEEISTISPGESSSHRNQSKIIDSYSFEDLRMIIYHLAKLNFLNFNEMNLHSSRITEYIETRTQLLDSAISILMNNIAEKSVKNLKIKQSNNSIDQMDEIDHRLYLILIYAYSKLPNHLFDKYNNLILNAVDHFKIVVKNRLPIEPIDGLYAILGLEEILNNILGFNIRNIKGASVNPLNVNMIYLSSYVSRSLQNISHSNIFNSEVCRHVVSNSVEFKNSIHVRRILHDEFVRRDINVETIREKQDSVYYFNYDQVWSHVINDS